VGQHTRLSWGEGCVFGTDLGVLPHCVCNWRCWCEDGYIWFRHMRIIFIANFVTLFSCWILEWWNYVKALFSTNYYIHWIDDVRFFCSHKLYCNVALPLSVCPAHARNSIFRLFVLSYSKQKDGKKSTIVHMITVTGHAIFGQKVKDHWCS